MNEFIIENDARIPFKNMSKEDQHIIIDAKLNAPESVDIDCINHWESSDPEVIHIYAIYRVRAIDTTGIIWDRSKTRRPV